MIRTLTRSCGKELQADQLVEPGPAMHAASDGLVVCGWQQLEDSCTRDPVAHLPGKGYFFFGECVFYFPLIRAHGRENQLDAKFFCISD